MFSVPYLDMVRMPTGRGKKSSSEALMEADKLIFVSRINSRQSRRGGGAGVLVQLNSISFIELAPCHHVLVTLNRGILLGMKLRIIRIIKGRMPETDVPSPRPSCASSANLPVWVS